MIIDFLSTEKEKFFVMKTMMMGEEFWKCPHCKSCTMNASRDQETECWNCHFVGRIAVEYYYGRFSYWPKLETENV